MTDVIAEFQRLFPEGLTSHESLRAAQDEQVRSAARLKYGSPANSTGGTPPVRAPAPPPPVALTPQTASEKMEELKSDPVFVKKYVSGDAQAGREMLALQKIISRSK